MATPSESFFHAAARALHFDLSLDTSLNLLWVIAAAIIAIVVMLLAMRVAHKKLETHTGNPPTHAATPGIKAKPLTIWQRLLLRALPMIAPVLTTLLAALGVIVLRAMTYDPALIIALKPVFMAWTIITAIYAITKSMAKTIFAAFLVAPLSLPFTLPYIHEFEGVLAELSFQIGKSTISALLIVKIIVIATLMLWTASAIKDGLNASLNRMQHIRWSTRQLLQNITSFGIYAIATLLGLSILGIDLTAFAVLGGALGVGIGLGLQKIASNFISGLILLSEQSIQVNDMIEIAGSNISGLVRHTGARYTLIETTDNREVMIPNDDLITNRIINWTYSDSHGVLNFDIGVSYESDLDEVREILLEVVASHVDVLSSPKPSCLLKNFADSAVIFAITVHLADVRERRAGIRSELLFEIWRRFKDKGIDIPYPQMTLHYSAPTPPES